MTSREGDSRVPAEKPSPGRRGSDRAAIMALVGVAAVLLIAFVSRREVARLDRTLGRLVGGPEAPRPDPGGGAEPVAARRGPDPNRVYSIRTEGAPFRGPASAPVTIVEFGDFQ